MLRLSVSETNLSWTARLFSAYSLNQAGGSHRLVLRLLAARGVEGLGDLFSEPVTMVPSDGVTLPGLVCSAIRQSKIHTQGATN